MTTLLKTSLGMQKRWEFLEKLFETDFKFKPLDRFNVEFIMLLYGVNDYNAYQIIDVLGARTVSSLIRRYLPQIQKAGG